MTHGGYSERRLGPRAAQIEAGLLADPGVPDHVRSPAFAHQRVITARALALCDLMVEYASGMEPRELMEPRGKSGQGKPVAELVMSALRTASGQAGLLGLNPPSYAKIARNLSLVMRAQEEALARVAEAGRELVAQRELELEAGEGADGDG